MNVEGEQDASASAPASPITASTAGSSTAGATDQFVLSTSALLLQKRFLPRVHLLLLLIYPPAIPHPFKCAAAAVQLFKQCYSIPRQLRVFGRAITPPHYYTHTPWGWSDAPGL